MRRVFFAASIIFATMFAALPAWAGHSHHTNTHRSYTERYGHHAHTAGARRHLHAVAGRPAAWCGWEMRQLVGSDPGPAFNLARRWASWGRPGPAGIGAVVVWRHHVGKIVGQQNGVWVIESGNDGHAVRTRPRSLAGVIAIRWG